MPRQVLFCCFLAILSCAGQERSGSDATTKHDDPSLTAKPPAPTPPGYTWTKIMDSAAWRKTYNYQMFSVGDSIRNIHPDGAWVSADGQTWQRSPLSDTISNQAFLDYVLFKGALYGLGHFTGNIERFQFTPVITRSTNLRSWEVLSRNSNLPKRFFYHPFVFRDSLWIIGGEDAQTKYSDAWRSADGIRWEKVANKLPMGPRSGSQVLQLKDTLYLLDNDVWASTDGLHWTRICAEIVPGEPIFGYTALVYDEQLWLFGCNRNGQFTSQVLRSADGRNWQGADAPWLPRGGVAAVVHHNQVFLTGGKYGGTPNHPDFRYDNDLWVMRKN